MQRGANVVTYGVLVVDETLVVATQAHYEHYTRYVLEGTGPRLSFALLAADIDHDYIVFADSAVAGVEVGQQGLAGAGRRCIGMIDVHVGGHVRRLKEAVQICVVVQQAGTELQEQSARSQLRTKGSALVWQPCLVGTGIRGLDIPVFPQPLKDVAVFDWEAFIISNGSRRIKDGGQMAVLWGHL